MSMTRCRECGAEVSTAAAVCPHCGVRDPASASAREPHMHHRRRGGRAGWIVALLLLLVLAILFLLWRGDVVNFV